MVHLSGNVLHVSQIQRSVLVLPSLHSIQNNFNGLHSIRLVGRTKKLIIPEALEELYIKQGLTTYQIASRLGCCQATIWKRLHEFGIKPRAAGNPVTIPLEKLRTSYLEQHLSSRTIARQYGCAYSTIDRKLNELGLPTRTRAEAHVRHPRRRFDEGEEHGAYLKGFAMGDLRARKMYKNSETIAVDCGSTKREQLELFRQLFERYGPVWVWRRPNKWHFQAHLDLSFDFLLKKPNPKTWKDSKLFIPFLAGFVDAEGSFFISKGRPRFAIGNYDGSLLKRLRAGLRVLDVSCPPLHEDRRAGTLSSFGYPFRQNYWSLSVYNKPSLIKLCELLEPWVRHAKRRCDLLKVWELARGGTAG